MATRRLKSVGDDDGRNAVEASEASRRGRPGASLRTEGTGKNIDRNRLYERY